MDRSLVYSPELEHGKRCDGGVPVQFNSHAHVHTYNNVGVRRHPTKTSVRLTRAVVTSNLDPGIP